MRIGIDVRTLQGVNARRGIGSFTYGLLAELWQTAPEQEYTLFLRTDRDAPALPAFGAAVVRMIGVPTPPVLSYRRGFRFPVLRRLYHANLWRQHRQALARAVRDAGIEVLYLPSLVENDYFANAGSMVPTVATLYDLIPLVLHAEYIDTWMDADRERYRRQVAGYGSASAVVAISASAREDAIRLLGITPHRIRVSLLSVEDQTPPNDPQADAICRERYQIGARSFFLYASGSGPNKNLDRIVEGFVWYADRQKRGDKSPRALAIVGEQPEETRRRLLARAAAGLGDEYLRFCGFVPDADLRRLYAGARALVSVTRYEGFGLPAATALAAGIPVIAANVSSYPEVVGDAGLLVDPDDAEAIADGLRRLDEDDCLCAALSAQGRQRAQRLFTPGRQAKDYLAVFAEVAGK